MATRAVVGLGNPGAEYADTRHNAGWILLDHCAAAWGFPPFRRVGQVALSEGLLDGAPVRLVKPLTYMNRSGAILRALADDGWDPAEHLLVLVDDIALPSGKFRLRGVGSSGGHNGLKSIEATLGRQDYARLRIGVGAKPPEVDDLAEWVLGRMTPDEWTALEGLLDPMATAVRCWVSDGIERAMTTCNRP